MSFNEIIVDELPENCDKCGFHQFTPDPDGPDVYTCKALEYLEKDPFLGDHTSEHDRNYYKIREARCPLKLKGYCSAEISAKILNLLLTVESPLKEELQTIFRYFLNIKGDKNDHTA